MGLKVKPLFCHPLTLELILGPIIIAFILTALSLCQLISAPAIPTQPDLYVMDNQGNLTPAREVMGQSIQRSMPQP